MLQQVSVCMEKMTDVCFFESHFADSHGQSWFSSVKITRPQASGFVFRWLKKAKCM